MRSFIKITLGLGYALGITLFIINFIVSLTCFINPSAYISSLQIANNEATYSDAYLLGGILMIIAILWLIGVFVSRYVIKMLNDAYNKNQLIPSMILLFISFKWLSFCCVIFTPSKHLISTHPYFE